MPSKSEKSIVSLGDIAREAGVSRAAASYALNNQAGVSKATRERILEISKRMGYVPDARINTWMARIRDSKEKGLLPIIWLNTIKNTPSWHDYSFLSPYLEGAQKRGLELGYRIDEFWTHQPGMNMKKVSDMLYRRGIEGFVCTYPATHFRIDWNSVAGVAIQGGLLSPRLHRVVSNSYANLLLSLKMAKRYGYKRIGVCLEKQVDQFSAHSLRAAAIYANSVTPRTHQVPPLFYSHRDESTWPAAKKVLQAWIRKHRPEVIIGHSSELVNCVLETGLKIPEEIGIIHLATDDDVADWAGVCSNKRLIGATAIELLVSLMRNRQYGIPEFAVDTSIEGEWQDGWTLMKK
ncbi:LacI family DNA-binding transcriptional regulator [Cerasicoccus frondis]|uniref:LacI family DNA-binding transcriptional regulator n=1 Tax=Cerasicoccus frondis TaxID=490090 RepID=UPI00285264E4|nr:LacI family DNA-binding transcriptional regulator [Cerasicoccus frondis]